MLWLSFSLLTAGLGAGLVLNGGALPQEWNWSILAIALAGLGSRLARREREGIADYWITGILLALPLWVAVQMIPLPQGLVSILSPMRAEISREAGTTSWIPLSIAPARTFQWLLNASACAVTFLVIRDLAFVWRRNIWRLTIPILAFGFIEGALGLYQFYAGRLVRNVQPSSGTWINPDRFSGFLEMVLPLAVTGAFAAWRSGVLPHEASGGKALKAAAALTVAVTCLSGIVVSLSRAGFSGAIVSLAVLLLIALFAPGARLASAGIPVTRRITAGLAAIAATSAAFLFLPTDELIARFGLAVASSQSLSGETRLELWRDTRKLIAAYPLTGSGLGTYESALMRFKTAAPMRTADYAHNDYLQAAAELGIAGAAIGLIWIALVFARTLRASTSPVPGSPNRYLALGLAGSMVAILIHSLVDFNLYMPAEAMVFAWICGLAASSPLRAQASVTSTAAVRVIQSTSLQ